MDINEIIKVLKTHGASIRAISKATGMPKSSVHRYLATQCQGLILHSRPELVEGIEFLCIYGEASLFMHTHFTSFDPGYL